ncbi:MAG: hypothetical protein REI10_09095 [Flavobacterium lindanitolerans]|nr:hypothetical protein [Flavobacterium lindanitolerans]
MILASCADKISCIVRPGFPAFEIAALFTSTVRYPNSFSMTVHCRFYRVVIRNVQLKGFSKATDGCNSRFSFFKVSEAQIYRVSIISQSFGYLEPDTSVST